jgi:hypothetical protein
VDDTSIDLDAGLAAWPARPVLYGGEDTNAVMSALGSSLPLRIDGERIEVGTEMFEGEGYRLLAVIPEGDRNPELAWFAGTGPAGIAEINAGLPLDSSILVADTFGPLVAGSWRRSDDGWVAELGPRARRIEYRKVERVLAGASAQHSARVTFAFPAMVPPSDDDGPLIDACMRGLETVVRKLRIDAPIELSIYVYPDRPSKQQLTGNGGDGHAAASSRTVHVLAVSPDAAEALVAHEGAHVLAYYALGPAATPLLGEGLAVWVSGSYAGRTLDDWRGDVTVEPLVDLLGPRWLALAEQDKYPLAALVFEAAVAEVGLAAVSTHLLGASADAWAQRCAAAGTSPAKLEQRLVASIRGGE